MNADALANRLWYLGGFSWLRYLLIPVSALYCLLVVVRRAAYGRRLLVSANAPWPVLVVGNLTVGGTGKTPFTLWLVARLRQHGLRPAILCRGYRGRSGHWPLWVDADSDPRLAGDEAVMLAGRCGVPVVAGADRLASARLLRDRLGEGGLDLLVCDDGLQHYRLRRQAEIALVDGERGFGNGLCLPAGPMREPIGRQRTVDLMVVQGGAAEQASFQLRQQDAISVHDASRCRPLASFADVRPVLLTAIANPQRFFSALASQGIRGECVAFPDHHPYLPADLAPYLGRPVLTTEKDAVKLRTLRDQDLWYVPVTLEASAALQESLESLVERFRDNGHKAT